MLDPSGRFWTLVADFAFRTLVADFAFWTLMADFSLWTLVADLDFEQWWPFFILDSRG